MKYLLVMICSGIIKQNIENQKYFNLTFSLKIFLNRLGPFVAKGNVHEQLKLSEYFLFNNGLNEESREFSRGST